MTSAPPPASPYDPPPAAPQANPGAQPAPVNVAGRVAVVLAIVTLVYGIVTQAVSVSAPFLLRDASATSIGVVFLFVGIGALLLSLATAICGGIGLIRRDRPRIAAAVALGVGASGTILGIAGLVVPPLVGAALV